MNPKPPPPEPLAPDQPWLFPAAIPPAGELWDVKEDK